MIKKRFKQYTILKHKKRTQSFDIAFIKQANTTEFCAPNRVINALFKGFPISLSGCNYYGKLKREPLAYSFIKQKNIIFTGSWIVTLGSFSKKSISMSSLFPHAMLVRVLFVLQAQLVTILHANIL